VLLLVGEGVGEVRPAAGDTEVYAVVSGEQTRVVLIDQSGGTLAFDVAMTDMTRPLTAIVQEVAGPDDRLRGDLSDYRVLLAR
jgi:streptogramin lyase